MSIVAIHNAKKCTFDGRDLWLTCLIGRNMFDGTLGKYDPDFVSEGHATLLEALEVADEVAKRRGAECISVRHDDGSYQRIPLKGQGAHVHPKNE